MDSPPSAYVLVVDDDPVARLLAGRLLERGGYRVTYAEDGTQALQRAGLETFDAVVMDVHMPGLNGLEAAALMRKAGVTSAIVGVTGDADVAEGSSWRAAGMCDCLRKPFRIEEFSRCIHALE